MKKGIQNDGIKLTMLSQLDINLLEMIATSIDANDYVDSLMKNLEQIFFLIGWHPTSDNVESYRKSIEVDQGPLTV
jgi:Tat protein secretion system quality control protein TatD with DNase activity